MNTLACLNIIILFRNKLKNIIGTSFKHNSRESSDGRSKHSIYRAVIEVYARI